MLQQILLQILLLNCFLQSIVLYPQTCSKRYQHCKTYRSSGEIVIIFCCPERKKKIIFNCFHMWNRKYHDKQRYFNVLCIWNHEKIHKCTLYMYIYRNKSNSYRIIYAVKCVILWCFMSDMKVILHKKFSTSVSVLCNFFLNDCYLQNLHESSMKAFYCLHRSLTSLTSSSWLFHAFHDFSLVAEYFD